MDILMAILGYAGAIGIAIFSLPELIRCLKNKETSNINVWLFILLMVSSACFWISGFYSLSKNLDSGWNQTNSFSLAVAIANIFSFLVPAILLSYKLYHVLMAKKHGLTEKQYEEKIKTNK